MVCWYCYWGWPKPVADIYLEARKVVGEAALKYGPGHIVWGDENFNWESVEWCLEHFDDPRYQNSEDWSAEVKEVVRSSLKKLLELPDDILDPEPEDYDDNSDPGDFPPPPNLEMVRVA